MSGKGTRAYVGEYGLRGTAPLGRTKLLGAGGEPAVSAPEQQESEPKPAPATRQLREQQPQKRGGGEEWSAERVHDGCGGHVVMMRAGASGLDACCERCGREWLLRSGCGGWQRG